MCVLPVSYENVHTASPGAYPVGLLTGLKPTKIRLPYEFLSTSDFSQASYSHLFQSYPGLMPMCWPLRYASYYPLNMSNQAWLQPVPIGLKEEATRVYQLHIMRWGIWAPYGAPEGPNKTCDTTEKGRKFYFISIIKSYG